LSFSYKGVEGKKIGKGTPNTREDHGGCKNSPAKDSRVHIGKQPSSTLKRNSDKNSI